MNERATPDMMRGLRGPDRGRLVLTQDDLAADKGEAGLEVPQLAGLHRQDVAGEADDVGQITGLEPPELVPAQQQVRPAGSRQRQRLAAG